MNCEMKTQSKEIQWSIFGDLTKSLSRYLEYLNMNEKLVVFFLHGWILQILLAELFAKVFNLPKSFFQTFPTKWQRKLADGLS